MVGDPVHRERLRLLRLGFATTAENRRPGPGFDVFLVRAAREQDGRTITGQGWDRLTAWRDAVEQAGRTT